MLDKGAHYYRCDFQVHSPRDLSWQGNRPSTEEERKEYSQAFVRYCIENQLHAVAITDHHDVVFYQYIKEAADLALSSTGNTVTVFPGMEVSIAHPSAQILILFDPDLSSPSYRNVPIIFGITPSADHEITTNQTVQLNLSVQDIISRLSEIGLENRYIILPNVKPEGYKTFLRHGNHTTFSQLPCVGGYIEGVTYSSLNVGDRNILEGKVPAWSNRAYGVFQTSDSRHSDFSLLGTFSTWVKWTQPSTEAIRQACLSQHCRINHEPPQLPRIHIDSIKVSASRFLGSIDLHLNPQFNALIGGRGTGKSSLLEYIRWGLCDPSMEQTSEVPSFEKRRSDLVKSTLEDVGGIVTVEWSVNGVRHIVRRSSVDRTVELTIAGNSPRAATPEEVRSLLAIQAYSQKQLSTVGVNITELRRFIELPIQNSLRELNTTYEQLSSGIRQDLVRTQKYAQLLTSISENRSTLASLREQGHLLREKMENLSPEDEKTLHVHQQYMQDKAFIDRAFGQADRLLKQQSILEEVASEVSALVDFIPSDSLNLIELNAAITQLDECINDYVEKILHHSKTVFGTENNEPAWKIDLLQVKDRCEEHEEKYRQALIRNESNNETLQELANIDEKIVSLEKTIEEKETQILDLRNPNEDLKQKIEALSELYIEECQLYQSQCINLTDMSEGIIEASLAPGGDMDALAQTIREAFTGANIAFEKIIALCERIKITDGPFTFWQSILSELRLISQSTLESIQENGLPQLEILSSAFLESEIKRMVQRLDYDRYTSLLLYRIKQKPVFRYCVPGGQTIDFTQASAGQQASALLRILLSIDGPPLIIDQPEDDLDNAVISQISEQIWKAKQHRQLIFSSHNANLVVNGDAELVVHFGYINDTDHSRGFIMNEGSIDVKEIKDAVTNVMEGGDSAFKLRQQKYGF